MGNEAKRYRHDTDYGQVLHGIIEGYARAQGISFGSMVRLMLSDKLQNELQNIGGYEPYIQKRNWK